MSGTLVFLDFIVLKLSLYLSFDNVYMPSISELESGFNNNLIY